MMSPPDRLNLRPLASALLLAVIAVPASAAPVNFSCSPTKLKGAASTLLTAATTSMSYVNVPETAVAFKQGGTQASCVIVRFSAQVGLSSTDSAIIRAFLDNTTSAVPDGVGYTSSTTAAVHSYEFVFPSVAPGNHALRMQYKSFGGSNVMITYHTTVVHFAP